MLAQSSYFVSQQPSWKGENPSLGLSAGTSRLRKYLSHWDTFLLGQITGGSRKFF